MMKNNKTFDCFTFFNELDLLEIRLHELAPVVDVFVLAESSRTFQGTPKPLHYQQNRDRFAAFKDRIRHVIVDDMPSGNSEADHWRREHHQRNAIARALDDAVPGDTVLLSDVDEIPRARALQAALDYDGNQPIVHCFELTNFTYFLDFRKSETWLRNGPRLTRFENIPSLQGLRDVRPPTSKPIKNAWRWLQTSMRFGRPIRRVIQRDGGWHFNAMGGADSVAYKLMSHAHVFQPKSTLETVDIREVAVRDIETALRRTDIERVPLDSSYPQHLLAHRDRYAHLISTDNC